MLKKMRTTELDSQQDADPQLVTRLTRQRDREHRMPWGPLYESRGHGGQGIG
jgi:hypothetical protein